MERLIFTFLLFSVGLLHADMLPTELSFTLRQVPTCSDQYTLLELEIKNNSDKHNSILVPGHPQLGMGLFEILTYERGETMKWMPLNVYNPVLPDSVASDHKYMQFWNLGPRESFKQLFVLKLQPSNAWAFQVRYQPHVCTNYFKYAFRWYNDEGEPSEPAIDGDQRFAYQGPMYSNLCEVDTKMSPGTISLDRKSKVYLQGNWTRVKRQIQKSHTYPQQWPILSKQLYSQAVLSSLPTYSHQYLIVESKTGIFYISLGYRLGKRYLVRGFLAQVAHMCGARRVFWKTSSTNKVKLTHFQVQSFS
ncbi:MAG: hypothetical protein ACKOBN_03800 [Flavobacteriales bacterium]